MDTNVVIAIIVIVAIALVALAAVAYFTQQRKRSTELREGFGPEYDRAVKDTGSKRDAEEELRTRRKRVEALNIRPLSREDRERFGASWQETQARFVDAPDEAIADADRLVGEVMQTRGYPVGQFDQRAADISVDHPRVVDNYRKAHDVAEMHERGEANTEDLRQAMICYRSLFEDLLETPASQRKAG